MINVQILKSREYQAITPEQLYHFDQERGPVFDGPTTEEVLEWDELSVRRINEAYAGGEMPDRVYRREVPEEFKDNYAGFLAMELQGAHELYWELHTMWKLADYSRPRGFGDMSDVRPTIHKQGGN